MPGPASSVTALPDDVLAEVHARLRSRDSIASVARWLRQNEYPISRPAMDRYAKRWRRIENEAAERRELVRVAHELGTTVDAIIHDAAAAALLRAGALVDRAGVASEELAALAADPNTDKVEITRVAAKAGILGRVADSETERAYRMARSLNHLERASFLRRTREADLAGEIGGDDEPPPQALSAGGFVWPDGTHHDGPPPVDTRDMIKYLPPLDQPPPPPTAPVDQEEPRPDASADA